MDIIWHISRLTNWWVSKLSQRTGLTPRSAKYISVVLWTIFVLLAGIVAEYYATNYLEEINAKAEPAAYFSLPIEGNPDQQYLPLIIKNYGNKKMTGVWVEAATCLSVNSEGTILYSTYSTNDIGKNDETTIKFNEPRTINQLAKRYCPPAIRGEDENIAWQEEGCFSIKPFATEPSVQQTSFCLPCGYRIVVHSDQLTKDFNGFFRAPLEYTITITPEKEEGENPQNSAPVS